MNNNFKYELNERLTYSKEWAFYFSNRLKHFRINEKIQEKIYKVKGEK